MFADCLITSLGFGTHTLQIHDHPSHYLHIFPLRIIMAFTTTAHILMSCRPGHTEVIIYWKWSWWASTVCTISSLQGRWGDFHLHHYWVAQKNHIPIILSQGHAGPWSSLSSPEKRVSAKCGDKTHGMLGCFCLSVNHLSKHVHISHFLAQFHCLQNGIYKLL